MKNKIVLHPCISSEWKSYKLKVRQPDEKTIYHITIENPDGLERGNLKGTVDGNPVKEKDGRAWIETREDGKNHRVILRMYTPGN